jgi:hypothetical protein
MRASLHVGFVLAAMLGVVADAAVPPRLDGTRQVIN